METLKKRFKYKKHEVVITTTRNGDVWTWRYTINGLQAFAAVSLGHWTEVTALIEATADAKKRIDEMA